MNIQEENLRLVPSVVLLSVLVGAALLTAGPITGETVRIFVQSTVPYGIIAIGLYPVMIGKHIDLSQFAIADLIGALIIVGINTQLPIAMIIPLVLLLGALIGLVNGIVVARLRVHPILTTYCMSLIIKGVMFIITKGRLVYLDSLDFLQVGKSTILGIPTPVMTLLLCFAGVMYTVHLTILGRKIIATGSNGRASFFSGIRIDDVKIIAFMISGSCAALAGTMAVAASGSVATGLDLSVNLSAIVIVVLGGTDLLRKGNPLGLIFGLLLFWILERSLIQYGIDEHYQQLFKGIVLLMVILANNGFHQLLEVSRKRPGSADEQNQTLEHSR
ncbi:MAG: ABC transporter permease [Spirochaetia bacterium]|nr:ABC transporter permease [Spirochaetia bacterium]